MAKKNFIGLYCFGHEIGRVGYDENEKKSTFQYNPSFLESGLYSNLFPTILKRTKQPQVFSSYNSEHFRGLPPVIADSLPDVFGNVIFKAWMDANNRDFGKITVIEQLAYVANRGMGALEYKPSQSISAGAAVNIDEIVEVLKKVLENKHATTADNLNSKSILNIFKIGTSAGGARPKILLSEDKRTGKIIPGDLEVSDNFNHYLVKLALDEDTGYQREIVEYCYSLTAVNLGITMMPSKLIDGKHFATLRFDRQNGTKKHILTASGMTGWDFAGDPQNSSYENLFALANFLKLPHRDIDKLFRRMVFNLVFANADDHLKNHSFIYDEVDDKWNLSPAYDLTYSLNPLINIIRHSRALSINNKRTDISLNDILAIADKFTIKNPKGIIENTQNAIAIWTDNAHNLAVPEKIITNIIRDFKRFKL